LDQVWT
jgi:hypothetical protein